MDVVVVFVVAAAVVVAVAFVVVVSHAADFASPSCRKRIFSGDRKERKKKFWQAPTLSGINEKNYPSCGKYFYFYFVVSHRVIESSLRY